MSAKYGMDLYHELLSRMVNKMIVIGRYVNDPTGQQYARQDAHNILQHAEMSSTSRDHYAQMSEQIFLGTMSPQERLTDAWVWFNDKRETLAKVLKNFESPQLQTKYGFTQTMVDGYNSLRYLMNNVPQYGSNIPNMIEHVSIVRRFLQDIKTKQQQLQQANQQAQAQALQQQQMQLQQQQQQLLQQQQYQQFPQHQPPQYQPIQQQYHPQYQQQQSLQPQMHQMPQVHQVHQQVPLAVHNSFVPSNVPSHMGGMPGMTMQQQPMPVSLNTVPVPMPVSAPPVQILPPKQVQMPPMSQTVQPTPIAPPPAAAQTRPPQHPFASSSVVSSATVVSAVATSPTKTPWELLQENHHLLFVHIVNIYLVAKRMLDEPTSSSTPATNPLVEKLTELRKRLGGLLVQKLPSSSSLLPGAQKSPIPMSSIAKQIQHMNSKIVFLSNAIKAVIEVHSPSTNTTKVDKRTYAIEPDQNELQQMLIEDLLELLNDQLLFTVIKQHYDNSSDPSVIVLDVSLIERLSTISKVLSAEDIRDPIAILKDAPKSMEDVHRIVADINAASKKAISEYFRSTVVESKGAELIAEYKRKSYGGMTLSA